ncbi:uncharacterized protein LOC122370120 isoform X2 [Amphibalanus amphitrite]|nr:uncharacterized protein LOC122370120 isoform X2 [Amphibalanus amphitrite]
MEEYKLDDKELAALEKLYDFPARSGRASTQVRAVNIIDTLSQMARTPEARRLAQAPERPPPAKQPPKQAPKQSPAAKQSAKPPTKRTSGGGGGGGRSEGDGPPPAPTLDREAIIARLLAEAARSPPPPIPSRRPDLSVLNIRAESANNAAVRGKLPTPPAGGGGGGGGSGGRQRDDLLDDLYGRIKGGRRPPELRRTPDWIRTIFDVARGGDISELRSSLSDMEPTLIRNLSDHHGNNLAHVLAACGHVQALAWLVGTCGHVLSEALADENKHGLTPSVAAVRCGKLDVIQWMVENTVIRERLFTREGERSLLHAAAKYGQVEITSWCADQLLREGQGMDLADHHGDTPLHLAAKTGNTAVAQKLLERNASVTARNDMSLKPFELAVHHGHSACAEYLLTYEALGDLAVDFTSLEAEAGRLQHENADYKNNFREVLSVSRKLLREREDMCKDLSRLHESTLELHDRLLGQLQQLSAENRQLRRRLQEPADEPADQLDESAELANTLHVRWQHCQRAWFSAPLADTQHRLLMAEQAWKRLRASRKDNVSSMTSAQEIVRNKIGDLRAQSAQTRYLDPAALSSSENSLVDSELYQQISPRSVVRPAASDIYGAAKSLDGSDLCAPGASPARTNGRRRASRDALEAGFLSEHDNSDIYGRGASGGRRRPARVPRPARERRGKSVEKMERLSVSVTGGGGSGGGGAQSNAPGLARNLDLSKSLDFSDSVLSGTDEVHNSTFSARPRGGGGGGSGGDGEGGTPDRAAAQDELRRQLRGLALVSDSGSASVLEVIEPAGSEAGSTVDLVQREIEAQRRARQVRSRDSSRSRDRRQEPAASEAAKQLDQVRMRRNTTTEDDSDFLGLRTSKPHRSRPAASEAARAGSVVSGVSGVSAGQPGSTGGVGEVAVRRARGAESGSGWRSDGGASLASLVLSEPDILQGTRHTLERPEEPAISPAPRTEPVSDHPADETADELERPLFELDGRAGALPDAGAGKRRGFLQKFAMRTRWNSRKKERAWRPGGGEISGDEFREMYQQEGRDLSVSSQDLSASEASSLEEKKRTSLGEVGSLSEASDAEHRSKRASVASKRESDSAEAETALKEPAAKPSAAAVVVEKRTAPPSALPAAESAADKPAPPPKPKIAAKPSTLPRRAPATAAEHLTEEVPRPASSASRPDSSASSFPPYKGFALSGGASSLSAELLPAAEGGAAGRHSPAPSEASKTESALSPPSHASDVSKTESTRHLNQLDKIEELRAESVQKLTADVEEAAGPAPAEETRLPPPAAPQPVAPKLKRGVEKKLRRRRDDRPWYEVSDDESDLLHAGRYQPVQRSSSDEDAQLI